MDLGNNLVQRYKADTHNSQYISIQILSCIVSFVFMLVYLFLSLCLCHCRRRCVNIIAYVDDGDK